MSTLKNSFKLRSQSELDAEKEKAEQEKIRHHWLLVEKNRKTQEPFELKEISGWMMVGPIIGLLIAIISGIVIWLGDGGDSTFLWWILGISIAPLALFGVASQIEEDWKASLSAKKELWEKKETKKTYDEFDDDSSSYTSSFTFKLNGFEYKYGYIYTDSSLKSWFFKFAKFIVALSTILLGILAIILGFIWLGSISIAPTTIIIILLVMILLKK